MKAAYYDPGKCRDQIDDCSAVTNKTSPAGLRTCTSAQAICRYEVEYPYYDVSGRGTYDIRYTGKDPDPPEYFVDFLNLGSTQNALGVNINYTSDSSDTVGMNFDSTGDFIFETSMGDLEDLLNQNVRVALFYGDADYICNVCARSHRLYHGRANDCAVVRWRSSIDASKLHAQRRFPRCAILAIHGRQRRIRQSSTAWQFLLHSSLRVWPRDPLLPAQGFPRVLPTCARQEGCFGWRCRCYGVLWHQWDIGNG